MNVLREQISSLTRSSEEMFKLSPLQGLQGGPGGPAVYAANIIFETALDPNLEETELQEVVDKVSIICTTNIALYVVTTFGKAQLLSRNYACTE
jgi:hypothetical protein